MSIRPVVLEPFSGTYFYKLNIGSHGFIFSQVYCAIKGKNRSKILRMPVRSEVRSALDKEAGGFQCVSESKKRLLK